jgi:hypothetical protein
MNAFLRTFLALAPLAASPVLLFAIAEGVLDLGGGEKDLLWLMPWLLWSVVYAVSSLLLWRRGWTIGRSVVRSGAVGLIAIAAAAVVLAAFGQLGIGGRF